jgi:hypothetical protein
MGENRNRDKRKNKRKQRKRELGKMFDQSSSVTMVERGKVRKQKNRRRNKSDKKYHRGGMH